MVIFLFKTGGSLFSYAFQNETFYRLTIMCRDLDLTEIDNTKNADISRLSSSIRIRK